MGKIDVEKFCNDLKWLEANRVTEYINSYPYNCGYLLPGGGNKNGCPLSFDCIGLIKSYINEPGIIKKKSPIGYFVKPGKVIPDTTEDGIFNLCTKRSSDFSKVQPGSYLLYSTHGHGGIYVGNFVDGSGTVNTIECTTDWDNGVTTSYTDKYGRRWDHKGGTCYGYWIGHGLLSKYINYKNKKKRKTNLEIAKEVIAGKWGNYPERKKKLEKAGYNYEKIQRLVDKLIKK